MLRGHLLCQIFEPIAMHLAGVRANDPSRSGIDSRNEGLNFLRLLDLLGHFLRFGLHFFLRLLRGNGFTCRCGRLLCLMYACSRHG